MWEHGGSVAIGAQWRRSTKTKKRSHLHQWGATHKLSDDFCRTRYHYIDAEQRAGQRSLPWACSFSERRPSDRSENKVKTFLLWIVKFTKVSILLIVLIKEKTVFSKQISLNKLTIFSSISCLPTARTASIAAGSSKVTKPKPLKEVRKKEKA